MSSLVDGLYEFGEFRLDAHKRTLQQGQDGIALTPKAFDTLLFLIDRQGQVVTKDELMKAVWADSFVEESNLTQTIFMLRKALGQTRDQGYIVTVPGRGYRFVADVKTIARTAPALADTTAAAPTIGSSPRWWEERLRKRLLVLLGVAAVLILASAAYLHWLRPRPVSAGRPMLAVLPFENFTGDPAQEYFSDGLTEEMISQLGNLDPAHLGVIARTSVMHYKHSQESLREIGEQLGVDYVIEGSVRRDSDRVRITAQLIQVKDQSHLWAREYDRDLGHLLELQAEIAREVANEIEFSLSGRRPIEVAPTPRAKSYEAYDLYLKGRYFWNKRTAEGFRQAADYFQRAIDKDPSFGRAYAGLADTFSLMSTWYMGPQNELMPKARTAARRALELDETLAEAHASLALIKENYDYDWPGSEKEFRRAIQLGPQYPTAHQWYAEFLSWEGRFAEAFAESEQARQLDPISPIIATDHASIMYFSRQYDSAVTQCRSVLELDPNFDHARHFIIPSYVQLGRYDEAIEGIHSWAGRDENPWVSAWASAWEAAVYGRWGHAEEAHEALLKLEQFSGSWPYRTPALLVAYAGTGQKERVLELLERAYAERSNAIVQIKVDPMYDEIRSDPRFESLVRKIGLQP